MTEDSSNLNEDPKPGPLKIIVYIYSGIGLGSVFYVGLVNPFAFPFVGASWLVVGVGLAALAFVAPQISERKTLVLASALGTAWLVFLVALHNWIGSWLFG